MEAQETTPLDPSQLIVLNKLGNGCQGQVFQVRHIPSQQRFALKVIPTTSLTQRQRERVEFQVNSNILITHQLNSVNFPLTYAYWSTKDSMQLLFQLCQQNAQTAFLCLSNYVQRYNFLLVMLFDMLRALSQLQTLQIIHRDIKPQNILLKQGTFKLADLGLSRKPDHSSHLTNDIGNRLGRSPQFVSGCYDFKTDIWSLGVHIFYLMEKTLPFDEESQVRISQNPNQIEAVLSSLELRVDLQATGRRSKNILSFLHLVLSDMIVLNPKVRHSASSLLTAYFNCQIGDQSFEKQMLKKYLSEREGLNDYYLLALLAYHQFYRMDSKIKDDFQSNKRKVCLKVKAVILKIIQLLISQFGQFLSYNKPLSTLFTSLTTKWINQLVLEGHLLGCDELEGIQQALGIYKICKVQQKFPLIEWIVKVYKTLQLRVQGLSSPRYYLWDIPLQLYKMI